jgi:putative spermidine/putrescine transport system ATP-binding protein
MSQGAAIGIHEVTKRFGGVTAVAACSLEIPAGAFLTILGPSGSGKTTLLNLIAGFLTPDHGEITFAGRAVTGVPTHKRGIGMVFQNFALFPHMSVYDNVAFPLRMRARAVDERGRVQAALEAVRLGSFADRRPHQLSGGQKQRVAMARAIVSQPGLLLLDEPLSALDKNLREELQVEIKSLHRKLGSTFVCVTHDQQEALAMSDLVVVMRDGRIEQVAAPDVLYQRPRTPFVARFLGGANILPGIGRSDGHAWSVDMGSGERVFATGADVTSGALQVMFRPEVVSIERLNGHLGSSGGTNRLRARITETVFLGDAVRAVAERDGRSVAVKMPVAAAHDLRPGDEILLAWPADATLLMPSDGDEAVGSMP